MNGRACEASVLKRRGSIRNDRKADTICVSETVYNRDCATLSLALVGLSDIRGDTIPLGSGPHSPQGFFSGQIMIINL